MTHFAKVLDGIVVNVIVADLDFFETFVDSSPGEWIQTSYNTHSNVHYDQNGKPDDGVALRGNYAGVGFIYDKINDVFYPPQPYKSWTLNNLTWEWEAPIAYPNDGYKYVWNEEIGNWSR